MYATDGDRIPNGPSGHAAGADTCCTNSARMHVVRTLASDCGQLRHEHDIANFVVREWPGYVQVACRDEFRLQGGCLARAESRDRPVWWRAGHQAWAARREFLAG